MNISQGQAAYAATVAKTLKDQGVRVEADLRNGKITYKIREHSLQKLPYPLIVGDTVAQSMRVTVRSRGGEYLGSMPLETFWPNCSRKQVPGPVN